MIFKYNILFDSKYISPRSRLYDNRDGIPIRNLSLISRPDRYGYLDPYVNTTSQPIRPLFQVNISTVMSTQYSNKASNPT